MIVVGSEMLKPNSFRGGGAVLVSDMMGIFYYKNLDCRSEIKAV